MRALRHNLPHFPLLALILAAWWVLCSTLSCFSPLHAQTPAVEVSASVIHQLTEQGHSLSCDSGVNAQAPSESCNEGDSSGHSMGEWLKLQTLWLAMILSVLLVWGYRLWSVLGRWHVVRPNPVFRLENYPRLHLTFERLLN